MATFEKRVGGWRAKVRMLGVSESRTFTTKAQAQVWAADRERELRAVAGGALPSKTLREALLRYHDEVSPSKRGAQWEQVRLRMFVARGSDPELWPGWLPELDMPLASAGAAAWSAWRDRRLREVSAASVRREFNLLRSVFEVARREWRWVSVNPLSEVRRPEQPQARRRRPTADEIERLSFVLGYRPGLVDTQNAEVAVAWLLAFETAMRQGEILGLVRDHVDFGRRVAHLPRTKNGTSRDVPLSLRAVELLQQLPGGEGGRMFALSSASCDALFRKAKARAGVEDLRFHDSRREGTSRLAKKVDVLTLARITGHLDLKMLMVYYQTDMSDVARGLD